MKKIILFMLVLLLCVGAANAVDGVWEIWNSGEGQPGGEVAGGKYNSLAGDDGQYAAWAAPTTGGLKQVWYSGGWGSYDHSPYLPDGAGTVYTVLEDDLGSGDSVFAAKQGGGVDEIAWWGGSWHYNEVFPGVDVKAMAGLGTNAVFATFNGGGIAQMGYWGGWTVAGNIVAGPIGEFDQFNDIASYDGAGDYAVAAEAGGGLHEIWYSGGWNASEITSNEYAQVIAVGNADFYAAGASNGLDHVYWDGSQWQIDAILGGDQVRDMVVNGSEVWAALTGGGVARLDSSGWLGWAQYGNEYDLLANNGGGGSVFGASVPEPSTLALLGLGGMLFRRRRK